MAETPCCTHESRLCLLYVRSYGRLKFFLAWIGNFGYLLRKKGWKYYIFYSYRQIKMIPKHIFWPIIYCFSMYVTRVTRIKVLFHADRRRIGACGHFRSHDKDGGHTIRSAISEKPMLYANFTTLSFIEPELLPTEVLHCGNREFCAFWKNIVEII